MCLTLYVKTMAYTLNVSQKWLLKKGGVNSKFVQIGKVETEAQRDGMLFTSKKNRRKICMERKKEGGFLCGLSEKMNGIDKRRLRGNHEDQSNK